MECVTAHAEKGAGTKTTLFVGQQEAEEVTWGPVWPTSLVEQAAATGVQAALANGRPANHKSALAKAKKLQGNTQRALDQALNLAAKRGEEVEATRGALREVEDGRRKAEVEAAQLRVEVQAQRRRGDDLQQRLEVAELQVHNLTSAFTASFTAQQGLGPQGAQSLGSGSRSGSQ